MTVTEQGLLVSQTLDPKIYPPPHPPPARLYRVAFLFIVLFNSCARRKCQDVKSRLDARRRSTKCRQSAFFFPLAVCTLGLKVVEFKFYPSPPTGELAFRACCTAASPPIPTRYDPCGVSHTHRERERRYASFHCLFPLVHLHANHQLSGLSASSFFVSFYC